MKMCEKNRKVTIVGAGAVGSTYAYALAQAGLADEIVLTDFHADLAKGQAVFGHRSLDCLPNCLDFARFCEQIATILQLGCRPIATILQLVCNPVA